MSNNINNLIDKVHNIINELEELGVKVTLSDKKYFLEGSNYSIEIIIDIENETGLAFCLYDNEKKILLSYEFDTDLYDLKNAKNESFVIEILTQIENFLKNLINKQIMIYSLNRKNFMYFPSEEGYIFLKHGIFFTSINYLQDLNRIKDSERYTCLVPV